MYKNSRIFISLFIIASCGGGGGGVSTPTIPTTPAPIVNLSAEPTSVLLENTSTLTWSSTNATSCSATWTSQTDTSGSEAITITSNGNNSFSISCSGNGRSGSASVTVEGYRETDGVVVDGYISGAEVFIDEDDDWVLDSNENSTTSDNEGKFTIRYANGNLVSIGGTDLDSQTLLDNLLITHKLTGHSDFKAVTPVTSVAAFMEDPSQVNAALGIDSTIDVFTFDPVANKGDGGINDYLYEKGNQLTVLAYALQNIANNLNATTETTQDYFKAITEEIEKEYTETSNKVDIETEAFVGEVLSNIISNKSLPFPYSGETYLNESEDLKFYSIKKAIANVLSIIEVKSLNETTNSIINFSMSTFIDDIPDLLAAITTNGLVSSYVNDLYNYVSLDQGIDPNDVGTLPLFMAVDDYIIVDEDNSIEINIIDNDIGLIGGFLHPFLPEMNCVSDTFGLCTYTPPADYYGDVSTSYSIQNIPANSSANIFITINPINDAPYLGTYEIIEHKENSNRNYNMSYYDVDNDELILSLSGNDSSYFNLTTKPFDNNCCEGINYYLLNLSFKNAPDYETKNKYDITFNLSDGKITTSKDLTITIINIEE
jgi:hypothetical protein